MVLTKKDFYMKINNIFLAAIVLLSTIISSCRKDLMQYQNDPRIYFNDVSAGQTVRLVSSSFSFATQASTLTEDTIYAKVNIMGLPTTKDRFFSAVPIDSGTTAKPGINYKLLNGTVKANQITGLLPVIVYRTSDLKTITQKLKLKIIDALDFKAGVAENNYFSLNWNDALIKPDNWDILNGLASYFGAYSVVKYQFIINVTGRSSFPLQGSNRVFNPNLLSSQQMQNYVLMIKGALATYNNTHTTPLTDEFGVAITFP